MVGVVGYVCETIIPDLTLEGQSKEITTERVIEGNFQNTIFLE